MVLRRRPGGLFWQLSAFSFQLSAISRFRLRRRLSAFSFQLSAASGFGVSFQLLAFSCFRLRRQLFAFRLRLQAMDTLLPSRFLPYVL